MEASLLTRAVAPISHAVGVISVDMANPNAGALLDAAAPLAATAGHVGMYFDRVLGHLGAGDAQGASLGLAKIHQIATAAAKGETGGAGRSITKIGSDAELGILALEGRKGTIDASMLHLRSSIHELGLHAQNRADWGPI